MSWIIFTIAAATLQAFRNLEQKILNKKLDGLTVTWSRFLLPFPAAIIVAFCTSDVVSNHFIFNCIITAFFQIGGNFLLLRTIGSKNFSIGIAFYKTEVLQAMLLGVALFGQHISNFGLVAVFITSTGMFLMSDINIKKFRLDKIALLGALSGLFFAIAAFNCKFAAEEMNLAGYNDYKAGATTLMWVILFQNLIFVVTKSAQKRLRKDFYDLIHAENKFSFLKMSSLSFAGSIFWFMAFAIGEVIYVKAVGQFELIMAVLISRHLNEQHKTREIFGIILTAFGILALIYSQI